jgi:hypothetical protein
MNRTMISRGEPLISIEASPIEKKAHGIEIGASPIEDGVRPIAIPRRVITMKVSFLGITVSPIEIHATVISIEVRPITTAATAITIRATAISIRDRVISNEAREITIPLQAILIPVQAILIPRAPLEIKEHFPLIRLAFTPRRVSTLEERTTPAPGRATARTFPSRLPGLVATVRPVVASDRAPLTRVKPVRGDFRTRFASLLSYIASLRIRRPSFGRIPAAKLVVDAQQTQTNAQSIA